MVLAFPHAVLEVLALCFANTSSVDFVFFTIVGAFGALKCSLASFLVPLG